MTAAATPDSVHAARAIRTLLKECPGCGGSLTESRWSWLRLRRVRHFGPIPPHRASEIARSRTRTASLIDQIFDEKVWIRLLDQFEELTMEEFAGESLRSVLLLECGASRSLYGIRCTLEASNGDDSRLEEVVAVESSSLPELLAAPLSWIDLTTA